MIGLLFLMTKLKDIVTGWNTNNWYSDNSTKIESMKTVVIAYRIAEDDDIDLLTIFCFCALSEVQVVEHTLLFLVILVVHIWLKRDLCSHWSVSIINHQSYLLQALHHSVQFMEAGVVIGRVLIQHMVKQPHESTHNRNLEL